MDIIAVVFDYDDTLVPDSTTQLLDHKGIDTQQFWHTEFKELIDRGFCPTHAYLKLLLDKIGDDKPLGPLTNTDLRKFGKEAAKKQYPGLHGLIRDLKKSVEKYKDIKIEFYIISSGLKEIIEGNEFVKKHFSEIYGSQLAGEAENSTLKYIRRAITFTEKTRYLFEINKGITPDEVKKDPSAVNIDIPIERRRIPFKNIIYIGDGITDIPCFSLLRDKGFSFGIHHTDKTMSEKMKIFKEILLTRRTAGTYAPRYGKNDTLGDLIRLKVESRCADVLLERKRKGIK